MDFDNFSDRSRALIQSGQLIAQSSGHQQYMSIHILRALIDEAISSVSKATCCTPGPSLKSRYS